MFTAYLAVTAMGLAVYLGDSRRKRHLAGHAAYNEQQLQHGDGTISYGRYLLSSDFGQALLENWQSEYLQFALFIAATVWLVQRGSNESKPLENAGRESEQMQRLGRWSGPTSPRWARRSGGFRRWLYSNSLLLVMITIFLLAWFGQSVTGWTEFNDEQRQHDEATVSWLGYLAKPDFWEKTLQNWQSEFLAVGSMAILAVYLRARGSPESKPVGAPHDATGSSG